MVDLPDSMPIPISMLPLNKVGYPIPWFVHVNPATGEEDFRVIRRDGVALAYNGKLCWVCGQPRSGMDAFVIGPMCAVNHTSAEPPSHPGCARWSAQACPFLSRPEMVRRERGLEDGYHVAGNMIPRNPGVALVWYVRAQDWKPFRCGPGRDDVLFDIGDARRVEWLAHGRPATREEVLASLDSGMPILREQLKGEGSKAVIEEATVELERMYDEALRLVPA